MPEGTGDEGIEIDDDGDNMPHARGPDLVGTVDMGKVGGEERTVHISSPPGEPSHTDIDVNDAQEVLSGARKVTSDGDASSDDFVNIEQDDLKSKTGAPSDDGDIVLVDVDGASDDASDKKADSAGVNVGSTDNTTQ